MKISIGADHGGYALRQHFVEMLNASTYDLIDRGALTLNSADDYPDFAKRVSKDITSEAADFGILICTTGIGMSITANKFSGVRAALIHSQEEAEIARRHNDANVLVLSAKRQTPESAIEIFRIFVNTSFEGGRHARRIDKINSGEPVL